MTFDEAVAHVLVFEGSYVHDPRDSGGETKYGISKRAYPGLDIKSLTLDEAKALYRRDYWDRVRGDALPPLLQLPVFDAAVNQGRSCAVMMLQGLVGEKPDGVLGRATLSAISEHPDHRSLRAEYLRRRLRAYTMAPGWENFGAGWVARLLEVALK